MTKEYVAAELCEQFFNGIDEKTFRRNKKKYIALFEYKGFAVTEIKNGRGRHTIYVLEKIGKTEQQKADEEFLEILGCDIGKRNIELIKFLLKSILEKKIVPVQEELTHWARQEYLIQSTSRGVVKSYMKFFYKNQIIIKAMAIPVWVDDEIGNREYDPETGEILPTYHKIIANKVYYDYAVKEVGGYRKRLGERAQEAIDKAYNVMLREEFQKKIVPMIKKRIERSIIEKAKISLRNKVLKEVGRAYGLNDCVRIYEPIINPRIQGQLKSYFGLDKHEPHNMDIEIDTSHLKVVDVKRQVGTKPTEIEKQMEYHLLLKSHAQLYKVGKYAMPLYMYNKWHGDEAFESKLNELTVPTVEQNVTIPNLKISENLERYKTINDATLMQCESEYANENAPTFEKELSAFKFKAQTEVTTDDMKSIMLKGLMNKHMGVM
ncbi:hypothetical protein [Bacillus cereus]|uniref:hypothetical protein n=1 Tax=Bacillus cereus TaxID=1396 RepID=UPI000BF93E00|nr:hypothetical protein [Bacillus cereus]PES30100.1 hypothetical protein CN496_12130 [Bacillus cereus]PET83421.1 hypothetical protein CN528_09865 [Bacillus cereus]